MNGGFLKPLPKPPKFDESTCRWCCGKTLMCHTHEPGELCEAMLFCQQKLVGIKDEVPLTKLQMETLQLLKKHSVEKHFQAIPLIRERA
jgi:hypothetical protein